MLFRKKGKEMKKGSEIKKAAPSNVTPQRLNLMPQWLNLMRPDVAEERLRAIAAQEERRILANQEERQAIAAQEERQAQAVRTPAPIPAHAALVLTTLMPTEAAQDPKAARDPKDTRDNPMESRSAFRETPDGASVLGTYGPSAPAPSSICALTPDQCQSSQTIQEDCRALQEDCRALLAWYEGYAEETEQRQRQKAEDLADWQQGRSSSVSQSRADGALHRQISAPARPQPLRAGKRTQLGRAHQHWDTPEGRLLVQVRLCEAVLLPKMRAQDAGERDAVNARIAVALGLDAAAEAGVLTRFVVGWQATGRWPRCPVSVQLFWPGGKVQGDRLREKYGPLLVHLQEEARAYFNRVHFNAERPQ